MYFGWVFNLQSVYLKITGIPQPSFSARLVGLFDITTKGVFIDQVRLASGLDQFSERGSQIYKFISWVIKARR